MKRRVRGLLHRRWLRPLCAVLLAALPLLITGALVYLLLGSLGEGTVSLIAQISALFEKAQDPGLAFLTLMYGNALNFSHLFSILPGAAIFLGVYLFIGMPVSVSASGYFLGLLRGKNPPVLQVFSCFSNRYPRALGGMLYMALWILIWMLAAFVMPVLILIGGQFLIEAYIEQLGLNQVLVYGGLIGLCLVWLVSFTLVVINRVLAYAMTPVCIAAQPRLPAYRAVRLSRKLMRGCKWRLVSLYLSFANYFLPAIAAGLLLIALPHAAPLVSLSDILERSIRIFLWVVVCANQLVWPYLAPYMAASFRAFYIERKREALMDEEVTPEDFTPRQKVDYRVTQREASGLPDRKKEHSGFQRPKASTNENNEEESDDIIGV